MQTYQSGRREHILGDVGRAEVAEHRVGNGGGACTRDPVALPGARGQMGHAADRW